MKNIIIMFLISFSIPILIVFLIPPLRKFIIEGFKASFGTTSMVVIFASLFLAIPLSLIVRENLFQITTEENVEIIENEKEIVSLNFKQGISGELNGNFTLGMGSVNGEIGTESYFYFYTKIENRYKLEKVNAETVLLEETNNINPKIVYRQYNEIKVTTHTPNKLGEFLGLSITNYKRINKEKSETILYIPVGSIIENYNPNL